MPLIKPILQASLAEAFDKGMLVFADTIKNAPSGADVSKNAREAAAATFALIASTAIDLYIKTGTVTVPPGQVVAGAAAAGVVTAATTSPGIGIIT